MSYVNGTSHYNLPQTVGTDKRDWSDTNKAFADVDAALYNASEGVNSQGARINTAEDNISKAQEDISKNSSDISALTARVTTNEGAITAHSASITDVRNDLEDMISANHEYTAQSTHSYLIGDYFIYNDILYRCTKNISVGGTIIPNTNCYATNVGHELTRFGREAQIFEAQDNDTWATLLGRIHTFMASLNLFNAITAGSCYLWVIATSGADSIARPQFYSPTDEGMEFTQYYLNKDGSFAFDSYGVYSDPYRINKYLDSDNTTWTMVDHTNDTTGIVSITLVY